MRIKKLEVEGATEEQVKHYREIFNVLIEKGALDGVQSGSVLIHFHNYEFVGIQYNYFPWKKKNGSASSP